MKRLRKIKKIIKIISYKIISHIMSLFILVDNKYILFLSDTRESLGGNLLDVFNEIDNEKYKKIVITKSDRRTKIGFKKALELIYYISKSKYILLDDLNKSVEYCRIRKNQEVIQLWHGCGAFKRFGFASSEKILSNTKIHKGYRKYTKAFVSSVDVKKCFAKAFDITMDKMYSVGIPRTDILFDKKYIKKVKQDYLKKYPEFKNKKIILLAPTYRGIAYKNEYYDYSQLNIDALYKTFSKTHVFIIKNHPCMVNNKKSKEFFEETQKYKNFFYDLTMERDLNDLLILCDIFITDYSSSIFEYALLNKPIIYFTYDLEEYCSDKGLFFDFEEYVYGDVAKNSAELIKSIKKEEINNEKRKKFINKFMSSCNGNSTKQVVKTILGE